MSSRTDREQTFHQNPKVLSTDVGEEVALLSVERGRYYSLNPLATDIWKRLANPVALAEIKVAMKQAYDGAADEIDADIDALMAQLCREGLVTEGSAERV